MNKLYIDKAVEYALQNGAPSLTRENVCRDVFGIPEGSFRHTIGMPFRDFIEEVAERLPLDMSIMGGRGARLLPAIRERQLLACAVALSRENMYFRITRSQVAELAGVSGATVANSYSMPELRAAVVKWAIANDDAELIAQARVAKDPLLK